MDAAKINYDDGIHERYADARRLLDETGAQWMDAARRRVPARPGLRLLDVGCGTGRFSALLADRLDADVVGVEPSAGMRGQAERHAAHPRVRYLAGSAEALPVEDAAFDAAWLSMVIHHVPDLAACARELRRVLRPGGTVLVRNSFSGRLDRVAMYEFFPSALAVDTARLPTVDRIREAFAVAGFAFVALDEVEQVLCRDFAEFVERTRKRNTSTFELIPQADFEDGLRSMEAIAARGDRPGLVLETIDLLVLQRTP